MYPIRLTFYFAAYLFNGQQEVSCTNRMAEGSKTVMHADLLICMHEALFSNCSFICIYIDNSFRLGISRFEFVPNNFLFYCLRTIQIKVIVMSLLFLSLSYYHYWNLRNRNSTFAFMCKFIKSGT